MEIRDLDSETTKKEILEAVSSSHDDVGAKLVSLKKSFGDAQTAVVILPSACAKRIFALGRLRVGLAELPQRCYRCLAFDHVVRRLLQGGPQKMLLALWCLWLLQPALYGISGSCEGLNIDPIRQRPT